MNVPTAPYRVTPPPAAYLTEYLGWFVNKAVRTGRDNGYGNIVDDAVELFLSEFNVRRPAGGFVDSDGRNAQGVQNGGFGADGYNATGFDRNGRDRQGFDRNGYNAAGDSREDAVEAMVEGWDADTAAAVLTALASRVG